MLILLLVAFIVSQLATFTYLARTQTRKRNALDIIVLLILGLFTLSAMSFLVLLIWNFSGVEWGIGTLLVLAAITSYTYTAFTRSVR